MGLVDIHGHHPEETVLSAHEQELLAELCKVENAKATASE
jgi:hypothetical protein